MSKENIENYESGETDRARMFWNSVKQAASDFFEKKIPEIHAHREGRMSKEKFEEGMKELKDRAMAKEKSFTEGLIKAVEKAKEDNPDKDLLVLLDIDQTIAVATFDSGGKNSGNVVRPALKPLLSYLQSEFPGIKYGFLTTRGAEAVREQLKDERHLKEIAAFIDSDLIYSTVEHKEYLRKEADRIARKGTTEEYTEAIKKFNRYKAIEDGFPRHGEESKNFLRANPEVIPERIGDPPFVLNAGGAQKLEVIKHVREEHPHAEILVVDDFDYPLLLKNGFYADINSRFYL